jgi:hypothetical protein
MSFNKPAAGYWHSEQMKEVKQITEQRSNEQLQRQLSLMDSKVANRETYLIGATILIVFFFVNVVTLCINNTDLKGQRNTLKKDNWEQSMEIRKLRWDISDLKRDTTLLRGEIKFLEQLNNIR